MDLYRCRKISFSDTKWLFFTLLVNSDFVVFIVAGVIGKCEEKSPTPNNCDSCVYIFMYTPVNLWVLATWHSTVESFHIVGSLYYNWKVFKECICFLIIIHTEYITPRTVFLTV